MTIILTRGLPASGKSTWAKKMALETGAVRVNMDDIRGMLGLPFSKEAEELALKVQDQAILAAVKAGKDVIVDNTHIEKKMPTRYKKLFDGDQKFILKDFTDVWVEECVRRDAERGAKGGFVGPDVIRRMAARLQKVSITEEWLNDVKLSPKLEWIVGAPPVVVFDIDGTLAEHVARSPYDYSRVKTDAVFHEIAQLTVMYRRQGYKIMIMSGRPGTVQVRTDTENWLNANMIQFDELHMRGDLYENPAEDKRNDADVKQEMVDLHIRGKYNVWIWYDDRDRVVRRLRKLGIKVAQVADGDF